MIEGRMTVERVFNVGGLWGAELRVGGRYFASVHHRDTEEDLLRDAQAVANRWNEHAELLDFVRQVSVTEVGTLSLECAPTAARNFLNRIFPAL